MPLQRRDRCICALERTVGDRQRHTLKVEQVLAADAGSTYMLDADIELVSIPLRNHKTF